MLSPRMWSIRAPRERPISGLDGLRAIAAVAVVAHHVGFDTGATFRSSAGAVLARLDIGVPIFFALSGFLLTRPFVAALLDDEPFEPVMAFWRRRVARLFPAYWLALTVAVLAMGVTLPSLYAVVLHYGLLQIYDPGRALQGLPQAWSLCTEVSFYVALPLLALAARPLVAGLDRARRTRRLLCGVGVLYAVGVAWRLGLYAFDPPFRRNGLLWLPGQIDHFALGMGLAIVRVSAASSPAATERLARAVRRPALWLAAGLIAFATVCALDLPRGLDEIAARPDLARQFLYGLVALFLLAPLAWCTTPRGSARVLFVNGPLEWLGLMSYGIYLWHKTLIPVVQRWLGYGLFEGRWWVVFVITMAISTAAAFASWELLERPVLERARNKARRRPTIWTHLLATPIAAARPGPGRTAASPRRRAAMAIAALTATGFVLRLVYLLASRRHLYDCPPDQLLGCAGDAYVYHTSANLLAAGRGFISPLGVLAGNVFPSADHPPLYIVYLALFSKLGADSYLWHQLATVLLGAACIPIAGMLGVEVGRGFRARGVGGILGSPMLGVWTAAAVAFSPTVWITDGLLLSETSVAITVLAVLLAAYRFWSRPTLARAAALGALCGLAALGRAEAALLVPLVALPLALVTIHRRPSLDAPDDLAHPEAAKVSGRVVRRFVLAGVAGTASLAVVAPWLIRNQLAFDQPVALSTGLGVTMAYANCDQTYYGDLTGFWWFACKGDVDLSADVDQATVDARMRRQALDYIREHESRLPVVLAARAGRVWGLYKADQVTHLDVLEGRPLWASRAGLVVYYPLVAFAGLALALLRRARLPGFPFVAPLVVVTFAVMLTFGQTRYRATADAALVVLAAIGMARSAEVATHRLATYIAGRRR
jgi:peptidoglycan/LPS O-acetylase OafA/YrhL